MLLIALLLPFLFQVAPGSPFQPGSGGGGGSGSGCVPAGGSGEVLYSNGAGDCSSEAALAYDAAGNTLSAGGSGVGTANAVDIGPNAITAEGATADGFEFQFLFGDATADRAVTLTAGAAVVLDINSSWLQLEDQLVITAAPTGDPSTANTCAYGGTGFVCEGSTANGSEVVITIADPGGDTTFSFPAWATGTYSVTGYQSGTADPAATCSVGQIYYETDTAEGYACVATNTWDLMGGGAGVGTVTSVSADTQEFSVTDPTAAADIARVPCYAAGNATGAVTLNYNNGLCQEVTLTGNTTFTFTNPLNGAFHVVSATQDGTGSRTITWPGSVVWSSDLAQAPLATAGKTTHFLFMYDGTSYLGFSLNAGAPSWSSLTDPSGNLALSMLANQTSFTYGNFGAGSTGYGLTVQDSTSNLNDGAIFRAQTVGSSAAAVARFAAKSDGNPANDDGVEISDAGVLAAIGTGQVNANRFNGNADVAIADGGTGQSSQTEGFDALSPTTTKGDIIVSNGSDNIRVAVGTDGECLKAASGQASGVDWDTCGGGGDSYTLQAATISSTPVDGATRYFGALQGVVLSSVDGNSRIYIPTSGTITAVYGFIAVTGTTASGGEDSTVSIRLNSTSDTTVSSTVEHNAAANTYSNTGLSLAVAAGDHIQLKIVFPTFSVDPTNVFYSATIKITVP